MDDKQFKVRFIVGGVQKAGTTSLFGYLGDHPQLLPPTRKELHFFDDEQMDWASPDYRILHAFFPHAGSERLAFDTTPIYLFWPPALERIRRYDPEIKLIFIFRDPIERAWSHWRMEMGRSAEDMPFHIAIRQGRSRLKGVPPLAAAWGVYSYVERGFYARQVRRLFGYFPQENILLLRSLDLKLDHQRVLGRIADFLGVQPFPALPARLDHLTVGARTTPRMEDVIYLREIFREDVIDFSHLTGLPIDDWPTIDESMLLEG